MTADQCAALVIRLRDARARTRLNLPIAEELDGLLDEAAEALEEAEEAIDFMEAVDSADDDERGRAVAFITSRARSA